MAPHANTATPGRVEPPREPALRRFVDFYDPVVQGADGRGRRLDELLAWPDRALESKHDYIQILFPLPEGSLFSDIAPVVDEETMLYFRGSAGLQANLARAFERIVDFYGLEMSWVEKRAGGGDGGAESAAAAEGDGGEKAETQEGGAPKNLVVGEKAGNRENLSRWVTRMDHNHLRITRIIRSLRVLGKEAEARAFYDGLLKVQAKYGRIGRSSLEFWQRAVDGPLSVAPDGTEVPWLRKYEK